MKPTTPKKLSVVKGMSLYDAANPIQTFDVTFDQFDELPDCPIQRYTASRINCDHVRSFSIGHLLITAAVLPDGRIYKVDGHTRFMAAKEGIAAHLKGHTFRMDLISVKSMSDLLDLYETFDNRKAVKTVQHSLQSAFRWLDMDLKTSWIKVGKIASSLSLAWQHYARVNGLSMQASKLEQATAFKEAILLFDELEPKQANFIIGVGAAALLAFMKHGDNATEFFNDYNTIGGSTDGLERDAPRFLVEFINSERAAGRMAGAKNNQDHLTFTLGCFKRGLAGRRFYTNKPISITPTTFLSL